ncbi:MAG: LptF/LptG family permease [Armatimonadetes bacterium]|nr:LptF/LptG family permease [Armatimonadota bacterium]
MRLIDRYLLEEIATPFVVGVMVILVMLLGDQLYQLLMLVITRGVSVVTVSRLLLFKLPSMTVVALPLAVILATSLGLGRLVREGEWTSLRLGGAGLRRLLRPILVFGLAITALSWVVGESIAPPALAQFERIQTELAVADPTIVVQPQRWFKPGSSRAWFYVNELDPRTGIMRNVVIFSDEQSDYPTALFAREARFDQEKFYLTDVARHVWRPDGTLQREATTQRVILNVARLSPRLAGSALSTDEMSASQIREMIERSGQQGVARPDQVLDLHRRYAAPAACLVLALLCVPLNLLTARRGSFAGLRRLLRPILIFGLAITALSWVVGESIAPPRRTPMPARLLLPLFLAGCANATLTTHPRVYFDSAGLQRLRALSRQTDATVYGFAPADGWAAILARARALANGPAYHYEVQIPAVNNEHAGWKWSYTLSATPPPRHDESPHYPPWTALFQEREDSISTRLKLFSLAYLITGEDLFYQKAREIAFDLAQWPQWTDPSYGGLPACLDTGHCTQTMGLFYDWCYDKLAPAEREQLRGAIVDKGILALTATLPKTEAHWNGWGVFTTGLGVAALALVGEEDRAPGWVQTSIDNVKTYDDLQGSDGGSFEGPMYGTYAADSLAALLFALDSSQTAHGLKGHPFLAGLPRFAVNGLSPHVKGIATFGDGGFTAAYPRTLAMLAAGGDEAARYYLLAAGLLGGLNGIDDFLFNGPLLAAKELPGPPAWLGSDAFTDVGYAFLRGGDDDPYLAFKCGPATVAVGHNHYDANSFQITASGGVAAADPGYRSYFNPPMRRYTTSTFGHNTVVLDLDNAYLQNQADSVAGHDQFNLAGGRLIEAFTAPGIGFLTGEAAATYNSANAKVLDRFARRIVAIPPHGFVIRDELAAPAPHTFSWLLHGPNGAEVSAAANAATLEQARVVLQAGVWSPGGVTWRSGTYPGAESYGPYAAATTARPATSAAFTAALVPRANPKLLMNPGFERDLAGWAIRSGEDGPHHRVSPEQPHSGTKCGRIEKSGYFYTSHFVLPPGTKYTARVWLRTEGAAKGGEMVVYYWRGGTAFASERTPPTVSEAKWTQLTVTGTVPADCQEVCVALNYFDTGAGCWDDLEFTPDAAPQAMTPARIESLGADAADGVGVAADGWTHWVVFRSTGPVETDGRMAVVSVAPDGQVARALLDGGTRLTFEGKPVLRSTQRCTASFWRGAKGVESAVQLDLAPHAAAIRWEAVGLVVGG